MSIIRDAKLAKDGQLKIDWVKKNMPLLNAIEKDFSEHKYFDGLKMFSRGEEVKHQQGDRETSALPLT